MENKLLMGLDTFIRQYWVMYYNQELDENIIMGIFDDKKDAFDYLYSLSDDIVNRCRVIFVIYKGNYCVPLKRDDE